MIRQACRNIGLISLATFAPALPFGSYGPHATALNRSKDSLAVKLISPAAKPHIWAGRGFGV